MRSILAAALAAAIASPLLAQETPAPIQDNSFLIEEAYNQEPGVVQHINTFVRERDGSWAYALTQEWPLFSQRHQLSYTIPLQRVDAADATGLGDLMVNYRYQLVGNGDAPLAISPRASVILPTGSEEDGLGDGAWGVQGNLPVSYVVAPTLMGHSNVGLTHQFGDVDQSALSLGQSVVWLLHPRINLLTEAVWTRELGGGQAESLFISPGIRGAFDLAGGLQIVPGIAVPIGVGASHGERQVLIYLSFEHPFTHAAR
jgi:hypothetical protein